MRLRRENLVLEERLRAQGEQISGEIRSLSEQYERETDGKIHDLREKIIKKQGNVEIRFDGAAPLNGIIAYISRVNHRLVCDGNPHHEDLVKVTAGPDNKWRDGNKDMFAPWNVVDFASGSTLDSTRLRSINFGPKIRNLSLKPIPQVRVRRRH